MTRTTFEDRLLAELRTVVAERPAPAVTGATRRAPRVPRARLALAGGAVAAAAVAALATTGGGGATPAYAVVRNLDGSVTVQVKSLRDAAGLEQKLRAAGIPAVVDYAPPGKTCRQPRGRRTRSRQPFSMGVRVGESVTFTLPRGAVRRGQTLVLTSSAGSAVTSMGAEIVDGPVSPCQLVDAPAPPAPGPTPSPAPGDKGTSTSNEPGPSTHVGP
jgi:hypothetical protein